MAASVPYPEEITPPAFGVRAFKLSAQQFIEAGALMDLMMKEADICHTGGFIGRLEDCQSVEASSIQAVEVVKDTLRRDAVNPATNRRFFDPTLLERGFLWPQKNVITMTPVSNQEADAERVLRLREMFKDDVLEHDFFNAPQTQLESVYEATGVEGVLDSFFRMARSKQKKLLNAVNIDLEGELKTTPQLSMRDMRSFMSHLPGKPCAGITHPAAFIGQEGTSFNPSIEVCAFQGVNRHIAGAPKMWFMIPPRFFSAFVVLLPQLGVVTNDKFCTSLLNHNYIFLDPRTVVEYGIPVFTVVQKPGDVLYLLPHTIHWGINLGLNLNESVNIASASWAKSGMIAPRRCPCLIDDEDQLDLVPILKAIGVERSIISNYKKRRVADVMQPVEVLDPSNGVPFATTIYMENLLGPTYRDTEVRKILQLSPVQDDAEEEEPGQFWGGYEDVIDLAEEEEEPAHPAAGAPVGDTTLICPKPGCGTSYKGGSVKRLKQHVIKQHSDDPAFAQYNEDIDVLHPPRTKLPKVECPRCGKPVAGQLSRHQNSFNCR